MTYIRAFADAFGETRQALKESGTQYDTPPTYPSWSDDMNMYGATGGVNMSRVGGYGTVRVGAGRCEMNAVNYHKLN